ncbi:hypothetical protein BSKO_12710 [Bryopsis sp. KO-2023]|nr:hypothetical protein BSKO_12710 [Bryopsis sp. KO-2023]
MRSRWTLRALSAIPMKSYVIWIIVIFACGVFGLTSWLGRQDARFIHHEKENFGQFVQGPEHEGDTTATFIISAAESDIQEPPIEMISKIEKQFPEAMDLDFRSPGVLLSMSIDGNGRVVGRAGDAGSLLRVEGLQGNVIGMAGSGHSMASTSDGCIYTWGRNDSAGGGGGGSAPLQDSGQLGAPRENKPMDRPAKLLNTGPEGRKMVSVAAGRYHSVAASNEGKVYTWGLNDFGQLGREGIDEQNVKCEKGAECRSAELLEIDWGEIRPTPKIIQVRAGRYFTVALSSEGQVFTWGLNFCGEPGILRKLQTGKGGLNAHSHVKPKRITGFGDARIRSVDVGYVFSMLLDSEGRVWTCDSGSDGYAGQLPETLKKNGVRSSNQINQYVFSLPLQRQTPPKPRLFPETFRNKCPASPPYPPP